MTHEALETGVGFVVATLYGFPRDSGLVERGLERRRGRVGTGVVGVNDAHLGGLEVVLRQRGRRGLRGGVTTGEEQCVGGVVRRKNRENADHRDAGRFVGLVVREEVETQQDQFDVLAHQFLGAGLRCLGVALDDTGLQLHRTVTKAAVLVGVFDGGFHEPSDVGEVETARTTFGVHETDDHFFAGRCRQFVATRRSVGARRCLTTRRSVARRGRLRGCRFLARASVIAATRDEEQTARNDRGQRTMAPP